MLLDGLNSRQREAVTTTEGPMLIVAGPGTGKTRVLAHRIAYLVRDLGVVPQDVLAVTFTKNAASELKKRVTQLIGRGIDIDDMQVSTFHSVCGRILRWEEDYLGYENSFSLYNESGSMQVIGRAIRALGLDEKDFSPPSVMGSISKAKNCLVDCESYASWAGNGFYAEKVADIYCLYQQLLHKASALDYDDLLMVTVNLFNTESDVLSKYREQFRYVHVDNYQDNSHIQCELIDKLAGQHQNVCVAGDPDQSIYSFRCADLHNIKSFEQKYPQAQVVVLEQNYRSTKNILDAANAVLAQNQSRQTNNLWTNRDRGARIVLYQAEDENREAKFVVTEALNLGVSLNAIAVLYRSKAQPQVLESVLRESSVPYHVAGRSAMEGGTNQSDENSEGITLMTIHTATGLEFPVVFMVGMENGVFPTRRALDDPIEMEEERRLFYVGITRAQERLYLVSISPPSQFLQEIAGPLSPGEDIYHDQFGQGYVQKIDGSNARVAFDRVGVKWVPLDSLERFELNSDPRRR